MTATKERAPVGAIKESTDNSVRTYVTFGLAALALGVGVVWGAVSIADSAGDVSVAQQAAIARANQIDDNLDSLVAAGLAQQAAMDEAAQLQSRIEAGRVQAEAIDEAAQLQSHIAAGRLQAEAIASASAFHSSWRMRGIEMANHLDALVASGLAQQAAIDTNN